MKTKDIKPDAARQVHAKLAEHLSYAQRLLDKLHKRTFPTDDETWILVRSMHEATRKAVAHFLHLSRPRRAPVDRVNFNDGGWLTRKDAHTLLRHDASGRVVETVTIDDDYFLVWDQMLAKLRPPR